MFVKLCSSRRKTVKQCILDCILCHNVVLGGVSVLEVSAVCHKEYENGRHGNVSSGVNILINQRTAQPHIVIYTGLYYSTDGERDILWAINSKFLHSLHKIPLMALPYLASSSFPFAFSNQNFTIISFF